MATSAKRQARFSRDDSTRVLENATRKLVDDKPMTSRRSADERSLQRRGFFDNVGNAFKGAFNTVKNGVNRATNGVKNVAQKAANGVKNAANKAVNGVKNVANKAANGVKKVVNTVKQGAKNVIKKVQHGVKTAVKWVKKNGAPIAKFGLKITSAAVSLASKAAKFIPAPVVNKLVSTGLQATSMAINKASDAIPAKLDPKLQTGVKVLDIVKDPIHALAEKVGGKGGQALGALATVVDGL